MEAPELKKILMEKGVSSSDAQIVIDLSTHIATDVGKKIYEMTATAPLHLQSSVLSLSVVLINGVTNKLIKNETSL